MGTAQNFIKPYTGRGGARPGAGRPLILANQLAKAEKLAKQLHDAVATGLSILAPNYTDIVRVLICDALGVDAEGKKVGKPNVNTAMKLLEIGVRMASPSNEEVKETKIERLLKDALHDKAGININVAAISGPGLRGPGGETPPRAVEGSYRLVEEDHPVGGRGVGEKLDS